MKAAILVVNAGSSTHKCKLFDADPLDQTPLWEGTLDWSMDEGQINMHVKNGRDVAFDSTLPADTKNALQVLLDTIKIPYNLLAVGHRVVHGGSIFSAPVRITSDVKKAIRTLIPLAPLHNPANLAGIEALEAIFPNVPQFAVFDTAFHATIPTYAAEYPIPRAWTNLGLRRYGFHGISHSFCTNQAAKLLGRNVADLNLITCHLGNGSSVTAVERGCSIDTSMGFTPLEGLMMGTRAGSIDPGIILYLLKEHQFDTAQIYHSLNHDSGLKAISGTDGDMRKIIQGVSLDDLDCCLALDMYVHSLVKHIGAMAAVLSRIDALVFTAGIGENCSLVREEACNRLSYMGVAIDSAKNQACQSDADISRADSPVRVLVMHTQEEWTIAQACLNLLGHSHLLE